MMNKASNSEIDIVLLNNKEQLPLELLLLADPSEEQVMSYALKVNVM